jgi:SAM-dependent methyltransferase
MTHTPAETQATGGMSTNPAAFDEDLETLATLEFRIAQEYCADCQEYHALFGYGRLAKVRSGLDTDGALLSAELSRLARPGARILIGGAADAGLLALVGRTTADRNVRITVADRCPTPLAVCRHYVADRGVAAQTVQIDLARAVPKDRFDLILTHNVLISVPPPLHVAFLRNLNRALAERGRLLLVNRLRLPKAGGESPRYKKQTAMIEALAAKGIPLPEEEARFRARVQVRDDAERARARIPLTREHIEACLEDAGFRIEARKEHSRRRDTTSGDSAGAEAVRTYVFLASAGL